MRQLGLKAADRSVNHRAWIHYALEAKLLAGNALGTTTARKWACSNRFVHGVILTVYSEGLCGLGQSVRVNFMVPCQLAAFVSI